MIVGAVVDTYDGARGGAGKPPEADPSREYISGGGSNFPLMSQQVLTQSVDDLASDLGPQVYEVMLNDSTVSSAVAILITGALSGEFQLVSRVRAEEHEVVEPGSDRAGSIELSRYYRDFCQRNIDRLDTPIKLICHELLYAMVYGCKLAEVTYEMGAGEDAGKLVVKVIRTKRNKAWNFVVEPTGDVVAIRALTLEGGYRDLPPEKFLVVTWMPRDGDPRGRSILRPAYNPWNLKINLWPKYFKYLEKFGCPTIVGMTAPGASAEPELSDDGRPTGRSLTAEEAMAQMLARLDGGSYAAISNGASIHPIQPNNNGNAFLQAFNLFKTEILEGIIINARGVIAAAHTSKADNDSAKDTVGQITLYAREILEDAFRDQLFWNLICLNGGKEHADLYTPHVSLGEAEHQDIAALATAYNLIGYQADPSQFPAIDAKLGLPVRTLQEADARLPDGVDGDPAVFSTGEDPDLDAAVATIGDILADDPDPVSELADSFSDLPDPEWEAEARAAWDSLLNDQAEADDDPDDERSRRADLVATMALVLLELHAGELVENDVLTFNCGTGAGGFKEGNTCQPHGGGGGKGSRGGKASETTAGGATAKANPGTLTTRQAAALKGWATRRAKAEAARGQAGGGGAGGGKVTPAVKPSPAGTKPASGPGLTPRQVAARKGAETRRANKAARDLAAKDKAGGESKAKAKADAAAARAKAKADTAAARAKAKADADAARAKAKADATKAKSGPKSGSTTRPTAPGPGRPIGERIKADAEGDALVAAITKVGTSKAAERATELHAELKEIGVVSSGPKLARLAAIYQELEGVSRAASTDQKAINRKAHDLLATADGIKVTTSDATHTGSNPLSKLSAADRKTHDEATAFVSRIFEGHTFVEELKVGVGTLGADASIRSHVAGGNIMAMDPREATHVHVHELGHVLEFQVPGVSARVREFLEHRVGPEPLVRMNDVVPGARYDHDEMGRKDRFDRAFDTNEAYYIGKHYRGGTEVLAMGLEKLYNDPVGFASKDPEYFKFIVGITSGRLR